MRTNSGKDESRNRHLDPTMKEHERARGKIGEAVIEQRDEPKPPNEKQTTTGLGSGARKSGQEGDETEESPVQDIR